MSYRFSFPITAFVKAAIKAKQHAVATSCISLAMELNAMIKVTKITSLTSKVVESATSEACCFLHSESHDQVGYLGRKPHRILQQSFLRIFNRLMAFRCELRKLSIKVL